MQASERCEDTFKLPSKPDEVWINFTSILAIIAAPTPYGKTKRQYKVNTENCGNDKSFALNMAGEEYLKWVDDVFWEDKLQRNSIT